MQRRSLLVGLLGVALLSAAASAQAPPDSVVSTGTAVKDTPQPSRVQSVGQFVVGGAVKFATISLKIATFGMKSFGDHVDAQSCAAGAPLTAGCERYVVREAERLRSLALASDSSSTRPSYNRRE
jgi:hypothetical protein